MTIVRFWLILFYCSIASFIRISAQLPTYSKCCGVTSSTIPLRTMSTQKTQLWYNPADFGSLPVSSGFIDTLFFRSSVANQTATYNNLRISMKQVDAGSGFSGTAFETNLTQVYAAPGTAVVGATAQGQWFYIKLTTAFRYNPAKPLIVEVITDGYSGTGLDTYGSDAGGLPYKKLYSLNTSSNSGSPLNSTWQDVGFNLSTPPCTSPPPAGSATATKTILCNGDTTQLDLINNSIGVGQVFQWQSAAAPAGPWTNIGSPQLNATLMHVPPSSAYYRAMVTCNGNSSYSDMVLVNVAMITSGNYTINKMMPTMQNNFNSFGDAIRALRCGVYGPVTFNVIPGSGPYNEQIEFVPIPGTSPVNAVRFNGNGETLSFSPSLANARAAISLNGADHIIFDSLVIDVSTGTYGWGIYLTRNADSNTIRNCRILTSKFSTGIEFHAGIVIKALVDGSNNYRGGNHNLVEKNTLSGGYYNISFTGATPDSCCSYVNGNLILNNKLLDAYAASVRMLGCKRTTISGNDISRPTRTNIAANWSGLDLTYSFAMMFENNAIHNVFDSTDANLSTSFTGINIPNSSTVAAITGPTIIRNNVVYKIHTKYPMTGIALGGTNYSIHHNTISLTDTAATSAGNVFAFNYTDYPGASIFNNIFFVKRNGSGTKAIYNFPAASLTTPTINNNVMYLQATGGTNYIGRYKNITYTTLQDWRTAEGGAFDQQSVHTDPAFFSENLLIPLAPAVQDTGAVLGVQTDINGMPRSISRPDPGAYEVQKIYTFIGNGNWSDPANWANNEIPPNPVPSSHHIIISPSAGGSCIFSGTLVVEKGSFIKLLQGASFIVQGNIVLL